MKKRGKKIKVTTRDPKSCIKTMVGASPITKSQRIKLCVYYRIAFEALMNDYGHPYHFDVLVHTSNIALVVAEIKNRDDQIELIKLAQNDILRCYMSSMESKIWQLDQVAIESIGNMLALHDNQLCTMKQSMLRYTLDEVIRRLNNGDYAKIGEDTTVCA
jgi:hypothetical protein